MTIKNKNTDPVKHVLNHVLRKRYLLQPGADRRSVNGL